MAHLGNTIVNGALRVLGGENVDTINGVTVGSSPKFTDTNNAVTQTATTTDANYEVLFSATADNTTRTEGARKTTTLRFNPSTGSLMEGKSTVASGTNSHAEGSLTTANGTSCHAEGGNTKSVGDYSHSEGYMTTAINGSHAEGNRTIASKQCSHSEGYKTEAKGDFSHAEGDSTTASGAQSHAAGSYTCAAGADQTVVGKYNVADTSSLFIVGNGTANNARKNALSVASDGTVTLAGQLRTSFKSAVATGSYLPTAQTVPNLCTELRYSSGVMGSVSISTEYTKDGVTIPTGWYNFIWVPHRSGGNSGAASGDNCDYGVLYLTAMTMSSSFYLIRFSSGSITEVRNVLDADTGRYVCTDSVIAYSPINKTVTRVGGTAGWNSHIYSKNGYKDSVYVSFKASQANKALMVGLNSDPTTDANYTSLDYAWYLESSGTKTIYENGSKIDSYGTYSANDEFRIEVHGGHIYYFYISSTRQSGQQIQLIRVSGNSISKIFYLDSSFYDLSGSIYNLEFGNSIGVASKIQVEKEDGSSMGLSYLSVPFINQDTNDTLTTAQTLKYSDYFRYSPATHSIECGEDSSASGYEAFALGYKTSATKNGAFASGEQTLASNSRAHAEGNSTTASGSDSHAEGLYSCASGSGSHAEGNATRAIGSDSHTEGNFTRATAMASHAEGYNTTASSAKAHAEGEATSAANSCAHAEGYGSVALGQSSHAEGQSTTAQANYSHAAGTGTCAAGTNQTVIGQYNVADNSSLFIIGNGTSSARSNALRIDSSGNFYTNKLMKVYKESSVSTSTTGTWTAMCRSDQAGSPTLPTTSEWWNVISLNNWTDTSNNWVSQLAIATQDSQGKGVWWRTNDTGGTNISSSTWRRLADGQNDGVANIGNSLNFALTLTNNNKWYKLISMPRVGTNSNESFDMIISVSVNTYSYSNGTSATFLLHSHYGLFTLTPITATGEYCSWITNWRVTHNSDYKFVDFKVTLPTGATEAYSNWFRINCINLSRTSYTNRQYTVYDTLTAATSGTTVDKTYSINSTFRTLTASEDLEAGSATWTRTASTAGSVTLRRYGKVKELVIWGTALPAVSGAAVSTLQLSDPSYYPHNNVQFTGSDDNSQIVIGYITAGGIVYLANRSTSPIYCNVTYM